MSKGHYNAGAPGSTQNQGNSLGDRPCVKQSRLYRQHEGGNAMKELLGHTDLKWNPNQQEGAYAGRRVHDPLADMPSNQRQQPQYEQPPQKQQQYQQQEAPQQTNSSAHKQAYLQQQQQPHENTRMRRGTANQQSYNLFTGEAN